MRAHRQRSDQRRGDPPGLLSTWTAAACCRFPEPACWREPPWGFDGGLDLRTGGSEAGSVAESSTTAAGCGMKAAAGCRSPKRLLPPLLSWADPRSARKKPTGHPAPNTKRIKKPSERKPGLFTQRGIGWLVPRSHAPFHVRRHCHWGRSESIPTHGSLVRLRSSVDVTTSHTVSCIRFKSVGEISTLFLNGE